MATEQDIEDTDAVISDNDTSTVFPDGTPAGDFDASGNPYDNPYLLHRPHAFALMHGDGGAKISYGQLIFRIDRLNSIYESGIQINQLTQGAIEGLNIKVPTINTEDGKPMSSNINDIDEDGTPTGVKYHQLNGYGDVYLYWKVDLDAQDGDGNDNVAPPFADKVTKCWVTVDGSTTTVNIPAQPAFVVTGLGEVARHNRFNGVPDASDTVNHSADGAAGEGTYRVKLGTVNDGEPIKQDIASDVYWSILVHARIDPV